MIVFVFYSPLYRAGTNFWDQRIDIVQIAWELGWE